MLQSVRFPSPARLAARARVAAWSTPNTRRERATVSVSSLSASSTWAGLDQVVRQVGGADQGRGMIRSER